MSRPDPRVIVRPGLVRQLVEAPGQTVITVIAPAGYGKSTLIDAWIGISEVRVAACTIATIHDSVPSFGLHLVETIAEQIPDVAGLVADAELPTADWQRVLLPRLVRALTRVHLAIVLDDIHEITDPKVVDFLNTFVSVLPQHITLVLAGRALPDINLGKVGLEGRLVEITAHSLELTVTELRSWRRVGLSEESLLQIFNATGGWPAGVRMELMRFETARREQSAAKRGAEGLSSSIGRHEPSAWVLGDYLEQEVISRLSEEWLAFLRDLAVLTPVEPRLFDQVRTSPNTMTLLRALRNEPVPMVSLRDTNHGPMLVMHPLMAEHLHHTHPLEELERQRLLVQAARIYTDQHNPDLAFEAVRRTGDLEALARFVYTKSILHILAGRTDMVRRWLTFFSDELLRRYPQLALTYVAIYGTEGDEPAGAEWIERFGRWAADPAAIMLSEENVDIGALFAEAFSREGVTEVWASTMSNTTIWNALIATLHGHKLALDGNWEEAEAALLDAGVNETDLGINDIWRLSALAYVYEQRGRTDRADECAARIGEIMERAGLHQHANTYSAHVSLAAAAARRGDRVAARGFINSGLLKMAQTRGRENSQVTAYLGLARVAVAIEANTLANTCVKEARALMERAGNPPTLVAQLKDIARKHPEVIDPEASEADSHGLSSAELRVLQFLGSFFPVPRIAQELNVSPATVRTHIRAIYRKLQVHDRVDAVNEARRRQLIN